MIEPASRWYYEKEGGRQGPVDIERLKSLAREGEVTGETLVWTDGMADWAPFQQVDVARGNPTDPLVTCAHSGVVRPQSEMLPFGEGWVAPEHKDAFVQGLAEGVDEESGDSVTGYPFSTGATMSEVIVQSWKVWRFQAREILLLTAIVWLPVSILLEYVLYNTIDAEDTVRYIQSSYRLERAAEFWLGTIVAAGVFVLTRNAWNGGKRASLGSAFGFGFRNYLRLLGTRFLNGLILLGLLLVGLVPIAIVAGGIGEAAFLLAIPVGLVVLWLMVRLGCAESAAILIEAGGGPALSRSWKFTKGHFWKLIGFRIVVYMPLMTGVMAFGGLLAIPDLDNFVVSGLISALASCALSFTVVFEMVLAIHLNRLCEGEARDLILPQL